jgi:signal transduction histidine kinase
MTTHPRPQHHRGKVATAARQVIPETGRLRGALAIALGDPALRVAYRQSHGGWVDPDGAPLDLAEPGPGRAVRKIRDERGLAVAAIVHAEALRHEPELVDAAATFATLALDNQRLVEQVRSSLDEVRESRARIQATADEERRRIERDLHDGAQQRLVGLRIKLELAEELVASDPLQGRTLLRELGDETVEALEAVRALAHGVYPALLAQRGLGDALADAVRRSPIPAHLKLDGVGRYDQGVESAVYFCCLEALQNAAKHAVDATEVVVSLRQRQGALRLEVADDGQGFDVPSVNGSGAGLANMRDRLAAVGGELVVRSVPGEGTRVTGTLDAL